MKTSKLIIINSCLKFSILGFNKSINKKNIVYYKNKSCYLTILSLFCILKKISWFITNNLLEVVYKNAYNIIILCYWRIIFFFISDIVKNVSSISKWIQIFYFSSKINQKINEYFSISRYFRVVSYFLYTFFSGNKMFTIYYFLWFSTNVSLVKLSDQ